MLKIFSIFSFVILFHIQLIGQNMYFPPNFGSNWDTLSVNQLGWCEDKLDTLINYLEEQNSKAFILLKDGKIVAEKYYGTFTQDSSWYWASAGKTITALAIGIAQQENYLSINDLSSDYLDSGWTSAPAIKEDLITVRNQLTMTSGLDDGVADPYCTNSNCLFYLSDAGDRWAYHNAPYTLLLDGVLANATGQTVNQYVNAKIATPIGMTGYFLNVGFNNFYFSSARSMARFGLLNLNQGNWNSTTVLSDSNYFADMTNTSQPLNLSYGYLWWLNGKSSFMAPGLQTVFPGSIMPDAPDDLIAAIGFNGQLINIVPSQNLVLIRMGEAPESNGAVPMNFNNEIWKKLNDVMCTSTAIKEQTQETFEIYPNPVKNKLIVSHDKNISNIELLDMRGNLIKRIEASSEETTIATGELKKGIYFVRLNDRSGSHRATKKMIIW